MISERPPEDWPPMPMPPPPSTRPSRRGTSSNRGCLRGSRARSRRAPSWWCRATGRATPAVNVIRGNNDTIRDFYGFPKPMYQLQRWRLHFLMPAEPFGMNMLSDQSSNSFGSSDFGWDDEAMTPDYTSVFFPNAVMPAYGEPPYLQGGAPKRMRNNYGAAVPSQTRHVWF